MNESCENCRFWKQDQMGIINGDGRCHKNPPVAMVNEFQEWICNCFPRIDLDEWCGEWQEKKIPPDFLSMPISCLGITENIFDVLKANGICIVEDLTRKNEDDLLRETVLDKIHLLEIMVALSRLNLKLKPNGDN